MQKKSIALFVVCGLVAAMFFFSLGILTSRPAQAQPIYSKLTNFPRQSELWSVVGGTYDPTLPGRTFTVQRDSLNRLPVLTTIHSDSGGGGLYHKVGGVWERFERADYANNTSQAEGRFHQAIGVVLQPGEYAVYAGGGNLIVSGYWALP